MPTARRDPSRDTRGCTYSPGASGRVTDAPFRSASISLRPWTPDPAGPGTYTNNPVLDTLYWAIPVKASRLTPSTTGTAPPDTSSRSRLNGRANRVPPTAYTI